MKELVIKKYNLKDEGLNDLDFITDIVLDNNEVGHLLEDKFQEQFKDIRESSEEASEDLYEAYRELLAEVGLDSILKEILK